MIEFKHVHKTFPDGTEALDDFSMHIDKGELVTLIGPSGCGKTTTMKLINRLIRPTSGEIMIRDRPVEDFHIHELRWNTGYVLQEIALFPHMSIEENIAVVPDMKKWKRREIRKRSAELLEMVGLDPATYKKKMPDELSGGEQQRVGVIRALAADPDIILMDEPFSALDPISKEQLQTDIQKLQQEIQKTIVFVTHDMDEALALGDRVCLMQKGQVVQYDTPQNLILHPKNNFVKDFIGERKSSWQTAVDVICSTDDPRIMTAEGLEDASIPETGLHFIQDADGQFLGAIQNGKSIGMDKFPNHLPLYKAAETMRSNGQSAYPVVKDGRLIGVLNDRDIVTFLERHIKVENGVVQT